MQKTKILFISHTFPPITGGVENQNYELSVWLGKISNLTLLANRKRWLIPFFLPYATLRAVFSARKYDTILLGSGLLGIVGWSVKKLTRKPVIAVLHGLDLTWQNSLYQKLWVKNFIPSLDKLICVGNETVRVAKEKGLAENKIIFIPNGVDTEKNLGSYSRADLEKVLGLGLENKKVILTSGRLAKRKGVAWFIQNTLPKLPENILYVVAGDGPDKETILEAIRETNAENRVKMLGYVPDETRNILLNTADLFIQPNIKIEGDMEGFGLSVIEASACRLPVIASRLEGLQDAIIDGQNGFLVASGGAEGFVDKIAQMLNNEAFRKEFGEKARQFTIEHYSWEIIAKKYAEVIKSIKP
jgi:phosphatidylinositol alpha-1,6-mannosyltransferase